MKERSFVLIFLLMVLFLYGCGEGGGGSSSTFHTADINFTSDSEIYFKEREVKDFAFYIKAKGSSDLKYKIIPDEKDADIFILTELTGRLIFNVYNYKNSEKKAVYEIDVYVETFSKKKVQNIKIINGEKPTSTPVVVVTTPPTSTPKPTPTPEVVTPTPTPTRTPSPTPKWTPTPMPLNQPPLANAGADISTTVNQSITLRGSGSDSDGRVIRYEWKIGSRVLATTAYFEYLPTVVGTDRLTFTVTDDDGAMDSDTVLLTVNKIVETTTSKWITATKSVCESNGGTYNKYDENQCFANWENAKAVCHASGGSLPTIETLREVVTDCGGVIDDWDNNIENSSYQVCYKEKRFTSGVFWSSTTHVSDSSGAWFVYFDGGDYGWRSKTVENRVRCVRGGQ